MEPPEEEMDELFAAQRSARGNATDDETERWKAEIEEQDPENIAREAEEKESRRLDLIAVLEAMSWAQIYTAQERRALIKHVRFYYTIEDDRPYGSVEAPNIQTVTRNSLLSYFLIISVPNAPEILLKARDCGLFECFVLHSSVGQNWGPLGSLGWRCIIWGVDCNDKAHIIVDSATGRESQSL